ncbi:hypothetical protein AFLA_004853 [Aspergillus flavus NRRL3357]|nr:hypothetical protein AFLA_004853 [Aspergillus flavus NRRL3357]
MVCIPTTPSHGLLKKAFLFLRRLPPDPRAGRQRLSAIRVGRPTPTLGPAVALDVKTVHVDCRSSVSGNWTRSPSMVDLNIRESWEYLI